MTKLLESRLCLCLFALVKKSRRLLSPWQVNQHSNAVGRKMAAIYIRPTIIFFVWVVSACMYAYVYVCACIQLYIYMLQYGTTQLRKGFHSTEWTRCLGVCPSAKPRISHSLILQRSENARWISSLRLQYIKKAKVFTAKTMFYALAPFIF